MATIRGEKWWAGSMNCCCYLRSAQDFLADRKTPYERRFGEPFKGTIILIGAMVEDHPISARDLSRIHQFGKKVLLDIFPGHELTAGRKGDVMIADLEELEKLEASEIYPRRINAKEVLISHKGEDFIFPFADGTAKVSGRDYKIREPTLRRERTVRSEDLSGEPGESQPTESTDDAEAHADFRSIQGDFIYGHHNEPRVQLYVPKEETFPIPFK